VLVALTVLTAIGCAVDTLRCVDAARTTARLLARGDPPVVAVGEGRQLAPRGADVSVSASEAVVEVRVVARSRVPPWLEGADPLTASGDAVAAREDVGSGDGP
jgi:hypothetical protein